MPPLTPENMPLKLGSRRPKVPAVIRRIIGVRYPGLGGVQGSEVVLRKVASRIGHQLQFSLV